MGIITEFFELFGVAYLGDFSKFMFQSGAYTTCFYFTVGIPLLVTFVYYILLDHILLAQVRKWTIVGGVSAAVAAVVCMSIAYQRIKGFTFMQNITDADVTSADVLSFGFIVFVYAALLYVVLSVVLKSFSSRCRNIPF